MAKVNMDSAAFDQAQQTIVKAAETLDRVEKVWGENFDNLYANIVSSGFLNDLYEDAKSDYYKWKAGLNWVSMTAGGAALGCVFGPIGGIIGAIVGFLFGITTFVKSDPVWITVSKEVFEQLLANCRAGNDDSYIRLINLMTKMHNVQVSMESIKTKINDFQHTYANMSEAANEAGIGDKVQYAADGLTVTNVNTTINIDGTDVETTVSEAMNAFYTYTATVTAAEIEAAYLKEKYPDMDIDFSNIVKNANAFMTKTLNSDLYTKEFVDKILPTYEIDENKAKESVTGATGLGLSGLETLLGNNKDLLGDIGLYAGLIGASFIDKPASGWPEGLGTQTNTQDPAQDPANTQQTPSGTNCGGCGGCGGCGSSSTETPTTPETPETPQNTNTVEIETVTETTVPEKELEFDYGDETTDFDKLAREAYEFGEGAEEIAKHQQELLNEIEAAYEAGNLDAIREKLKEYGFSGPEIEAILADKSVCIKTLMYCDKREILAAKARELAEAAGVKDYDTKYDDPIDFDKELSGDGANELLMLASEDETCVKAYESMNTAKESYEAALKEANPLISKANENKKAMEEIKAKYEKEFSSTDTKKWSEAAAKEYNEAIKAYNTSVTEAAAKMATVEAAKTTYQEARTAFETAEKNYYDQIKQEQSEQPDTSGSPSADENGNNNGNDNNNNNNGGKRTDLTTDDIVFNDDGDIVFDLNGQVQGATLDTSDINLNTGATTNIVDPADQAILDSLNITNNSIETK